MVIEQVTSSDGEPIVHRPKIFRSNTIDGCEGQMLEWLQYIKAGNFYIVSYVDYRVPFVKFCKLNGGNAL